MKLNDPEAVLFQDIHHVVSMDMRRNLIWEPVQLASSTNNVYFCYTQPRPFDILYTRIIQIYITLFRRLRSLDLKHLQAEEAFLPLYEINCNPLHTKERNDSG